MSKAELVANLRQFPTATVSGNKEDLAKRLYFFRKRPERPKIVLDIRKIRDSLEPKHKIFDQPKEEEWKNLSNMDRNDLKNYNIEILQSFLSENEKVQTGVQSQSKKGRMMYLSNLVVQADFYKSNQKLLVRTKI